ETGSFLADFPEAPAAEAPLPAAALAAISADVLTLASEFLGRRADLAPRPRQEIAAELADLIRRTSGLEPPAAQSTENFLAAVIRQAGQIAPSPLPPPTLA